MKILGKLFIVLAAIAFVLVPVASCGGGGGAIWLTGSGPPDMELGARGDLYLNTDNGDIYQKASVVWLLVSSIVGAIEPPGPPEPTAELVIEPLDALPDDIVHIKGSGFPPNTPVDIFIHDNLWITVITNISGAFEVSPTVPPLIFDVYTIGAFVGAELWATHPLDIGITESLGNYSGNKITWAKSSVCAPLTLEIWKMTESGSDQVQLTFSDPGTINEHPVWADGGQRIVFTRTLPGGAMNIWIMNQDGSGQTQLTSGVDNHSFAHGDKIYFVREEAGLHKLRMMNLDGSNVEPIPGLPESAVDRWHPSVDGRGDYLVFMEGVPGGSSSEIKLFSFSDQQLVTIRSGAVSAGTITPPGDRILFSEDTDGDTFYGLVIRDLSGTPKDPSDDVETILTSETWHDITPYAKSPTGLWIDFVRFKANPDIFRIHRDGTNEINLTNSPGTIDTNVFESSSCNPQPPICEEREEGPPLSESGTATAEVSSNPGGLPVLFTEFTLEWSVDENSFIVVSGIPGVDTLTGTLEPDGSFIARGMGAYANQPDIQFILEAVISSVRIGGLLTIGAGGNLVVVECGPVPYTLVLAVILLFGM